MLDKVFSIASAVATVGWLFLVFAPRWRWSARVIAPMIIPVLLAIVYTAIVITTFGRSEGGFGSLNEVAALFRNRYALLAGWIHYLAFDLFIGSWEVRDAQRLGIPHLAVIPSLLLTFLFGPMGLLLHLAMRTLWKKVFVVDESAPSLLR